MQARVDQRLLAYEFQEAEAHVAQRVLAQGEHEPKALDVNGRDMWERTALMLAVQGGHDGVVGALVAARAPDGGQAVDVNLRDSSGRTVR